MDFARELRDTPRFEYVLNTGVHRVAENTPAAPELPAEVTAQRIKQTHPDGIRQLTRAYGQDQINLPLGYEKMSCKPRLPRYTV